jgi:predicted metal-dependent hydrolase
MGSGITETRRFRRSFAAVDPSRSLHSNPVTSHFYNAFSLLFPEGERFFIRNVMAFADAVDDPDLRSDVNRFARQESLHGNAHERMNANLRDHGFDVGLIQTTQRLILMLFDEFGSRFIDPRFGLAITVAMEHFTAVWGEWVIDHPDYMDGCDDVSANLMLYHSIEEVEHKHVAFDVYRAAGGPEAVRWLAMLVSTGVMWGGGAASAANLLVQDRSLSLTDIALGLVDMSRRNFSLGIRMTEETLRFFSTDFHPNERDYGQRAQEAARRLQLAER